MPIYNYKYNVQTLRLVLESALSNDFGRIDWVGVRTARREDGRVWLTRVPQEIPYF